MVVGAILAEGLGRIADRHDLIDGLPWWWADASGNDTVDIAALSEYSSRTAEEFRAHLAHGAKLIPIGRSGRRRSGGRCTFPRRRRVELQA